MEREENYSPSFDNYSPLDLHHHHQQHQHQHQQEQERHEIMKPRNTRNSVNGDGNHGMVDYMINTNNHHHHQHQHQQQEQQISPGFCVAATTTTATSSSSSFDKLSFADVMQFAEFGPKLALNQTKIPEEETGIDPVCFLKFPVLNDKLEEDNQSLSNIVLLRNHPRREVVEHRQTGGGGEAQGEKRGPTTIDEIEEPTRVSDRNNSAQHVLRFLGEDIPNKNANNDDIGKNKRKRPRTIKSSEEVESQRMTHIAVERNRRKQMNEHLRVLRALMPGSYVQRGDQASIIGGAIEFVRELEQLLQCLESQKRRRLLGESQKQIGDNSMSMVNVQPPPPPSQTPLMYPSNLAIQNDQMKMQVEFENGLLQEETAENKSCLADIEVKLLGFDAMIKILSRRRPGQLIKTIAALEDLQLNILHTNITTIEQTVLYSFNVKVASDTRFTADDIASSVQQIFGFIHANSIM